MIDVSDGIAGDLRHICEKSGVSARLYAEQLPVSADNRALARAARGDEWHFALHGGEDYELLFTAPPGRAGAAGAADHLGDGHPGLRHRGDHPRRRAARAGAAGRERACPWRNQDGITSNEKGADDRGLGFGRRGGNPGGPEDIRGARGLRDQRHHGAHRAEHGRESRACSRSPRNSSPGRSTPW